MIPIWAQWIALYFGFMTVVGISAIYRELRTTNQWLGMIYQKR